LLMLWFHCLTPKCYDDRYIPEGDVFSSRMLFYELLTRQLGFPKDRHSTKLRSLDQWNQIIS
jgi:hypothetical protein